MHTRNCVVALICSTVPSVFFSQFFLPLGIAAKQAALVWACAAKRWKDDDDWVMKCMEYEVEGPRPRGRPKRTWREVVWEDCQARKLNTEDAMDRSKWRKMIKDVQWSGWVWAGECFFWYRPTWVVPDKRPLNGCVSVFISSSFLSSPLPSHVLQWRVQLYPGASESTQKISL